MQIEITADALDRSEVDVEAMDLASLGDAFVQNTSAYLTGRSCDNRFALELFRRAVLLQDQGAWATIHDAYLPLVLGWVTRHPALARCGEDSRFLANRAFERFWHALRPERLGDFSALPALLKYLKMCAHCAVVDAARAYRPADDRELERVDVAAEGRGNLDRTEAFVEAEQIWAVVRSSIDNPTQERLAWESLVMGMTPREVLAAHPEEWGSIGQVYEAKAALLGRLRSHPNILEFRPRRPSVSVPRAS
jgi:hypothetical protein